MHLLAPVGDVQAVCVCGSRGKALKGDAEAVFTGLHSRDFDRVCASIASSLAVVNAVARELQQGSHLAGDRHLARRPLGQANLLEGGLRVIVGSYSAAAGECKQQGKGKKYAFHNMQRYD